MENKLMEFAERLMKLKSTVSTEEATKTALIMPFFHLLGYDVFNPLEFIPEFTCDVGIKKGEKVDYAISLDGEIVMVIEAKCVGANLSKVDSQLARYFHVTDAKIAILTDGIIYKFFSDIEKDNVMDSKPFFEIDLTNLNTQQLKDVERFSKANFDAEEVITLASDLRTLSAIKEQILFELNDPSEDFVKIILNGFYDGMKTKQVIEKHSPLVKKAFVQLINERVADKLSNAISGIAEEVDELDYKEDKIQTTEEEMQFYQIVKSMVVGVIDLERIYYRDTENYFNILVDDNARKWLCRIKFLKDGVINIYLNNGDTVKFNSLDETYKIKDVIIDEVKKYI